MRVCLISNHQGPLDEGMRNVAYYLALELEKRHQVLNPSLDDVFSLKFWRGIKDFQPEIIHYIPGPSVISLIIARMLKLYCNGAKVVISATQPRLNGLPDILLSWLKPDLVVTQSNETEQRLADAGYNIKFLPNGVDTEKFIPVSLAAKKKLREKYSLNEGKFIFLHVGSITKRRNVDFLTKIQKKSKDNQVLIIGSTSTPLENDIYKDLKESGCTVWRNYFKNIEEIYALSDCYIFPAFAKLSSVDLPISVLEAMSNNLPVVTTRFGALPRIFTEGDGLIFVNDESDIMEAVEKVKNGILVKTREKALPYSWEKIAMTLDEIYLKVRG